MGNFYIKYYINYIKIKIYIYETGAVEKSKRKRVQFNYMIFEKFKIIKIHILNKNKLFNNTSWPRCMI